MQELWEINQYLARRSNGEISWIVYEENNLALNADFNYIIDDRSIVGDHRALVLVKGEDSFVFVYGEMYKGFSFGLSSTLELRGKFFLSIFDSQTVHREESIDSDCIIEVNQGLLAIFLCDNKHIVFVPDDNSSILLKVICCKNKISRLKDQYSHKAIKNKEKQLKNGKSSFD